MFLKNKFYERSKDLEVPMEYEVCKGGGKKDFNSFRGLSKL